MGKVMCELMHCMIIPGGLVISCMRSRDINAKKMKGRGTVIWQVCMQNEIVFNARVGKKLGVVVSKVIRSVVVVMASSESLGSSMPNLVDFDVREEMEKLKGRVDVIDFEGGRRLENVEGDLAFLRKEFKRTIRKSESAILRFLANLEVKVDKLEPKVVKLESASK